MDQRTFEELIKDGELSLILMDGGANLTKDQMTRIKAVAKKQSEERLLQMANELVGSPGFDSFMSMPIISSLVGGKLKKKQEDKKVVSVKKNKKDPNRNTLSAGVVRALAVNDSQANVLGKIYNFMRMEHATYLKNLRADKKYRKKLDDIRESNTQELIDIFSGKKNKTKKLEKTKKDLDKKSSETTPKKVETETKIPENKSTQSPVTKTTPTSPAPTATKSVTSNAVSTATKVVAGTAALGATASAIGGAESGGSYDITYGDRVDRKTGNVVHGSNLSPEERFGKKLTELTLEEVDILGKERNKNKMNTSAMGKYQFMNSTLFGSKGKNGLVQQLGLDMKTKFTPEIQDKLYEKLHSQQVSSLKNLGVPLTPGYEYMAHYLGPSGAKAVYDKRNTNMTVQQAIVSSNLKDPVNGKVNEELTRIKASEFESILEKRLQSHGLGQVHAEPQQVPSTQKTDGDRLDKSSSQNKDLKKTSASVTGGNVTVLNNNQNIINGSKTYQNPDENTYASPVLNKQYG